MAEITWKSILTKLVGGDHLTAEESEWFVDDLMQGNANPAAVGAALAMQQQLGLTADEVRGAAKAMVSHAVPLNVSGGTTDIVGTGGDGFATVNLSTMGSVAAAAAGVKIVKHGNRAASSKCGAADVLEALGLLDLKPEAVGEVGDEVGITFAFARTFHPAMRFVGPIRAALGIPCVFNILGPLTNPANLAHVAIGCANRKVSPIMAAVYASRGQSGLVEFGIPVDANGYALCTGNQISAYGGPLLSCCQNRNILVLCVHKKYVVKTVLMELRCKCQIIPPVVFISDNIGSHDFIYRPQAFIISQRYLTSFLYW